GKVIIYGGTIKRVEQITAMLGCVGYWRGVGNAKEKARRMEEWRISTGGRAGWIAATNALGMGIDDPGVCLVVHAGIPRQLVNVVQESGRGGLGGTEERQEKEKQLRGKSGQQDEWAWDDDVIEYAEGKRCRREVLDREMDGNKDRIGCVEGEEACDVCQ
ncbi:P-loop containing nucleoside triphosphate hydrolase protein, partial [Dactylonectria macrodidyma]